MFLSLASSEKAARAKFERLLTTEMDMTIEERMVLVERAITGVASDMRHWRDAVPQLMRDLLSDLDKTSGATGPTDEQKAERKAQQRKRDRMHIAAMAMWGLLAGRTPIDADRFDGMTEGEAGSIMAVEYADALLAALGDNDG